MKKDNTKIGYWASWDLTIKCPNCNKIFSVFNSVLSSTNMEIGEQYSNLNYKSTCPNCKHIFIIQGINQ